MKSIKLIAKDTGPLISFELMKEAAKHKAALKRLTTNDSAYYAVLGRFEVGHFDHSLAEVALNTGKEPADYAREVLKALHMEVNAAEWMNPEAGPVEPKPKATAKGKSKLFMKFNSEGAFEEVREHLRLLTGDDSYYNKTMLSFGYRSPNDIPSHDAGVKVYRELCVERNRVQLEHETVSAAARHVGADRAKELILTMRRSYEVLGPGPFYAVLDKYGCPTVDEAIRSFRLVEIMENLKDVIDYRNKS
jgi:hypothetical protein